MQITALPQKLEQNSVYSSKFEIGADGLDAVVIAYCLPTFSAGVWIRRSVANR